MDFPIYILKEMDNRSGSIHKDALIDLYII